MLLFYICTYILSLYHKSDRIFLRFCQHQAFNKVLYNGHASRSCLLVSVISKVTITYTEVQKRKKILSDLWYRLKMYDDATLFR